MENIEGGNCGLAVAVGAIGAAAIIGTAIWVSYIWASPKTWYVALFLFTGNAYTYIFHVVKLKWFRSSRHYG